MPTTTDHRPAPEATVAGNAGGGGAGATAPVNTSGGGAITSSAGGRSRGGSAVVAGARGSVVGAVVRTGVDEHALRSSAPSSTPARPQLRPDGVGTPVTTVTGVRRMA